MNRTPKVFYLTFGVFRLSESWEMQPMAFFILPNIGKAVFRSSYPYESLLFPFFVHCTPTKASFSRFSFIVSLRKLLFPNFRSLYPYESFFFPFFINCTPYLSDFSRKLMIYARIWVVFLIEQFRIVGFQKGIYVLTQPHNCILKETYHSIKCLFWVIRPLYSIFKLQDIDLVFFVITHFWCL